MPLRLPSSSLSPLSSDAVRLWSIRAGVLAVLLLTAASASAQSFRPRARSASPLPRDSQLAPLNLERAWWGQASVSYGRDQIDQIFSDEDNVYVISKQGLITAFEAETGRRLFSTLLGSDTRRAETPTTNATTLLIPIGMQLIAIDKFDGTELWKLDLDGQPSCGPGADDDRVYVGTVDGSVYAYNLKRIEELFNDARLPQFSHIAREWRFQAFGPVTAPPVSTGRDINFATRKGVMYGMTSVNRGLLYQFMTDGQIIAPVTRSGDRVLIPSTDLNLYCIDNRTGQLEWTYLTATNVLTAPRLIGSQVFVTPQRRGLVAVDVETGKMDWRQPDAGQLFSATPARVFADGGSGRLVALDRADGRIINSISMTDFTVRHGNERTDRIFLATPNGLVVCLRETGRDFPMFYRFPERRPLMPELFDPEKHEVPEPSDEDGDGAFADEE